MSSTISAPAKMPDPSIQKTLLMAFKTIHQMGAFLHCQPADSKLEETLNELHTFEDRMVRRLDLEPDMDHFANTLSVKEKKVVTLSVVADMFMRLVLDTLKPQDTFFPGFNVEIVSR